MGILGIYTTVTIVSFIILTIFTNWLVALFFCGWIGLFMAIFINEATPGHTMSSGGPRIR